MKNLLNEEINNIKYLFGYKKGVVISEQSELGQAPKELFTYVNGQKELNSDFLGGTGNLGKFVGSEVKDWCESNSVEGSVCVLGKSTEQNLAGGSKLAAAINLAKLDGYSIEKVKPKLIGSFEENSGDGTKQTKYYVGTVYSKS